MTTAILEELVASHAASMVPLTVDQLHEMIEAGIVFDGAPIELIDGTLVYKDRSVAGDQPMTHNPMHASAVWRLMHLLTKWSESIGCFVRCQLPVTLSETSEPEPDVAIRANDSIDGRRACARSRRCGCPRLNHMHPLTPRFVMAGAALIVAGIAIAVTGEGVGEHAGIIGGLVATLGVALVIKGVLRHWQH